MSPWRWLWWSECSLEWLKVSTVVEEGTFLSWKEEGVGAEGWHNLTPNPIVISIGMALEGRMGIFPWSCTPCICNSCLLIRLSIFLIIKSCTCMSRGHRCHLPRKLMCSLYMYIETLQLVAQSCVIWFTEDRVAYIINVQWVCFLFDLMASYMYMQGFTIQHW